MRPRAHGFIVVAPLVTLAIVAVAVTAAVRTAASAAEDTQQLKVSLLGRWVAQNRLAEHATRDELPALGTQSGVAEQGGMTFAFRESVTATPNPRLRRVEVSVFVPDRAERPIAVSAGFATRKP